MECNILTGMMDVGLQEFCTTSFSWTSSGSFRPYLPLILIILEDGDPSGILTSLGTKPLEDSDSMLGSVSGVISIDPKWRTFKISKY